MIFDIVSFYAFWRFDHHIVKEPREYRVTRVLVVNLLSLHAPGVWGLMQTWAADRMTTGVPKKVADS